MSRYIDADKLIENFATATKKFMSDKYFSNVKDIANYILLIRDIIIEQPTADVRENIKGEWIAIADEIGDFRIMNRRWIKCNQCNEQTMIRLDAPLPNFCPNCGADMRGEENAE